MSADPKPTVPYWHLWTDPDGISRQTRCSLTEFDLKSIQPPADPQWQGSKLHDGATVFVTVLPVGWSGDWHQNPKPQWIVPLSGRWYVESMDGQRVEMGPGEISFGEDQNTSQGGRQDPRSGGHRSGGHRSGGHRSGTVGAKPAVLMIVQLDGSSTVASPCRFR